MLGLGNQQQTANVNGAPLQSLGEDEPRQPGVQEWQGHKNPAVQSIVRVVTCPIVCLTVRQKFQGGGFCVLQRISAVDHGLSVGLHGKFIVAKGSLQRRATVPPCGARDQPCLPSGSSIAFSSHPSVSARIPPWPEPPAEHATHDLDKGTPSVSPYLLGRWAHNKPAPPR